MFVFLPSRVTWHDSHYTSTSTLSSPLSLDAAYLRPQSPLINVVQRNTLDLMFCSVRFSKGTPLFVRSGRRYWNSTWAHRFLAFDTSTYAPTDRYPPFYSSQNNHNYSIPPQIAHLHRHDFSNRSVLTRKCLTYVLLVFYPTQPFGFITSFQRLIHTDNFSVSAINHLRGTASTVKQHITTSIKLSKQSRTTGQRKWNTEPWFAGEHWYPQTFMLTLSFVTLWFEACVNTVC